MGRNRLRKNRKNENTIKIPTCPIPFSIGIYRRPANDFTDGNSWTSRIKTVWMVERFYPSFLLAPLLGLLWGR